MHRATLDSTFLGMHVWRISAHVTMAKVQGGWNAHHMPHHGVHLAHASLDIILVVVMASAMQMCVFVQMVLHPLESTVWQMVVMAARLAMLDIMSRMRCAWRTHVAAIMGL